MPHAIDIDGQMVTMFDPVNHVALDAAEESGPTLIKSAPRDRRWVRVKRPVVTVGGELTLEMLDLSFNEISKFYEAPLQLKANGGVFVVDDFGRQRIRPRDLLNRWIVLLESRVDYLTLHTGKKFEIPFDVLIVFATNLNPDSLADEAFLRRIPYKIYAKNPTPDEFSQIFALNCRRRRAWSFDPVVVEYLVRRYYEPRGIEMRACQPRDLVEQIVNLCRDHGRDPAISRELLDKACASYFLDEQAAPPPAPAAAAAGRPGRRPVRPQRRRSNGRPSPTAACVDPLPRRVTRATGRACEEWAPRVRCTRVHQQPVRHPRRCASLHGVHAHRARTGLLLLVSELLVVLLTAIRRPAAIVDRTWHARVVAAASVIAVPLLRPPVRRSPRTVHGAAPPLVGLIVIITGKVTLGRSFGADAGTSRAGVHGDLQMDAAPHLCRVPRDAPGIPCRPPRSLEFRSADRQRHVATGTRGVRGTHARG